MATKQEKLITLAAVGFAFFLAFVLYVFLNDWEMALAIAGIVLALDLTLLPFVFKKSRRKRDKDN